MNDSRSAFNLLHSWIWDFKRICPSLFPNGFIFKCYLFLIDWTCRKGYRFLQKLLSIGSFHVETNLTSLHKIQFSLRSDKEMEFAKRISVLIRQWFDCRSRCYRWRFEQKILLRDDEGFLRIRNDGDTSKEIL